MWFVAADPREHRTWHSRQQRISEHPRMGTIDGFKLAHFGMSTPIGPQDGRSQKVSCRVEHNGPVHLSAETDGADLSQRHPRRCAEERAQGLPPQRRIDFGSVGDEVCGVRLAADPHHLAARVDDHGLHRSCAEIKS